MKRIHWQGAGRAALLQAQLSRRLQAWAQEWGGAQWPEIVVSAESAPSEESTGNRESWWLAGSDGALMWISAQEGCGSTMAASALGLRDAIGSGLHLVEEVGKHCLAALHVCLWGDASMPTAGRASPEQPDVFEPRRGGLVWRMSGVPGNVRIAVNDAWCAARLPHETTIMSKSRLVGRRAAVCPARVRVDATIELGTVELLDSMQLRVGEVLVTDVSRNPGVVLSTSSGRVRTGRIAPGHRQRTVILD
ncbi:MAG: hypothetical protein J0H05_03610 [Stenotrophomonas acidaminiphila]|uniref:hypothetical protein n=1 Tax=Stenotrophomonas acidaminiphila TaxID=128780 RepID=UPI00095B505B|nr:hypothetical protein [Stenotrophomonas acidaminiphila]MBN8800749.1 hypothetical protein [Stenotrophomonas acidaminiphila]MDF9442285.1 hypothetical protein [Stenotrophomonas acidaminiphila]OJY80454.1 MAG: hypothetical protein BGP18_16380 [Stenotrophomonas sp. 69-14]